MDNELDGFVNQAIALGNQLDACFKKLDGISNESMHRKPNSASWSIAQILSHVKLAEALSLQYVQKKISFDPALPKAGMKSALRFGTLQFFMALPIKIKAARGVRTENLPSQIQWGAFKRDWILQRKTMLEDLRNLDSKWYGKEVYKHPIFGRISLLQMLRFFQLHFERHEKQIERALKTIGDEPQNS